jgi:oligoribonuclease
MPGLVRRCARDLNQSHLGIVQTVCYVIDGQQMRHGKPLGFQRLGMIAVQDLDVAASRSVCARSATLALLTLVIVELHKVVASALVWMDLEMSGLDPERDVIIEIATIVTTAELQIIEEGPVLALRQDEARIAAMDEWNTKHHTASGLIQRMRTEGVGRAEAEARTLEFVARHTDRGQAILCGNTIWQDRRFLARYMPALEGHLHYRMIDVSSIKELARRWRPDLLAGFTKQNQHLALADIRESIDELAYYRAHFFNLTSAP